MNSLNDKFIRDLIIDLYASLFDTEIRNSIMDRLVKHTGGSGAIWFSADGNTPDDIFLSYVGPEFSTDEYFGHYMHIDVWHQEGLKYRPGEVMTLNEEFNRSLFAHDEMFNDFILRQLQAAAIVSGPVERHGTLASHFSIYHSPGGGAISDEEQDLVSMLIPHFANWSRLQRNLDQVTRRNVLISEALNGLAAGVFVVDRNLRVLECNRAGEVLAREADGFDLRRNSIVLSDRECQTKLVSLVASACDTVTGMGASSGGGLRIPRPSGHPSYGATIMPLRRSLDVMRRGLALLLVTDPALQPRGLASILQGAFNLTAAEAEVAVLLHAGRSISDIADQRQVTIATTRNQVRSILTKSDTNRQSEFIRLTSQLSLWLSD